MQLSQPYYIEKRNNGTHKDLNGKWSFCWTDTECENVKNLAFGYECKVPASVYYSLYEARVLPHPYYGTNSNQYHWVDEKIWYYRKQFSLSEENLCHNAFLCFDGVAYYSRVWVNGTLLGEHEGMFGGPCYDVREFLNFYGENEIIVEVKACNFGKKAGYDVRKWGAEPREIVPWNIARDSYTSNGDFIVMGLWNHVRLELLNSIHISRPYMYTKSISEDKATIDFEVQIADGRVKELKPYYDYTQANTKYNTAFRYGLTGSELDDAVSLEIIISDNGNAVYRSSEDVKLTDYDRLGVCEEYRELQFYRKKIELNKPKLWYPNGLGDPFLYDVDIIISKDGQVCDRLSFKYGVRSFSADYTAGNKYRHHWGKYSFTVNGRSIFLKGMNWTPIDFLYDIDPKRYEWCLTLAKNAGIQLIRVWNGGGMPESDVFYDLCDKLGLMVWQDQFIANQQNTYTFPQNILENQIAYNLYRTRNHPSLVIICAGNEFNPYAVENAASMFVTQRTVENLVPDRIFYYTTDDQGSAHIYNDMEPAWYRHFYKQLPFVGESGIHSFPNFKTLKKYIGEKEASATLPDLSSSDFYENFPELLNHFSEYQPDRVPRMTSRISQIIDMNGITLGDLCEASQVQVYEYYQFMIQAIQENYPVCGGIMPWVFKRPWPTTAIQTVDGNDLPCYGYYAVMNAYKPVNVCWCQSWSVLAPCEEIPLTVKTFNQNNEDLSDCVVTLTVFNPDLTVHQKYESEYKELCDFGKLVLDDTFTNSCFLVCADVARDGQSITRSVYFNKCTDVLCDKELYAKHRTAPAENLYFDKGPYLKPVITQASQAILTADVVRTGREGSYCFAEIAIENVSDYPAFPVTVDLKNEEQRFFASENFFMLMPREKKTVRITCDKGEIGNVKVSLWNGTPITI